MRSILFTICKNLLFDNKGFRDYNKVSMVCAKINIMRQTSCLTARYVIMEDSKMKRLYRRRGVWEYMKGLALCAAFVLLLASGLGAKAARTGTISVESARVRAEASTEAGIAGSLASGDTVDIIGETESGGSTWYQVQYTQDGEQVTGWLRSDLLTVSGTEDEQEEGTEAGETEGTEETGTASGAFTIQEPAESPSAEYLTETTVQAGDTAFTAWQADTDAALYLVWAAAEDGTEGWYWYDPAQNTFQQDLGQFGSQGLVAALQEELTTLKESSAKDLSLRLYIIIGLGVLSVILLVLVIVFAVKSRDVEYEYYDEDEPEDDSAGFGEDRSRKKGGFFGKRKDEEEDEDDFDDFVEAVKRKRAAEEAGEEGFEADTEQEEEEEELPDMTLTANLPEIDMSAVDEVERKAEKTAEKTGKSQQEKEDEDDFDIEIFDLEDLEL